MKRILLFLVLPLFSLELHSQTATFNWNGGNNYYNGTIQTWTVPPCVTTVTVTAIGGAGGTSTYPGTPAPGGLGASITGTITVTPGDVLDILVAGQGGVCDDDGAAGGGGTFIWDNNTGILLAVAGGGGGGGAHNGSSSGSNGQTTHGTLLALETPIHSVNAGTDGTGGNGGGGGGTGSGACGGAGWLSSGLPCAIGSCTYPVAGQGIYPGAALNAGMGGGNATSCGSCVAGTGYGGYGGGAGGGDYGGGGGGGFNGGAGGGNSGVKDGGSGGGSYWNNIANITGVGLGAAATNGVVIINWVVGMTASTTVNSNSAACAATGSSTANPIGGTAPYVYNWTNGNTNQTATGLSAGSYTVTVTSTGGCAATANVLITAPASALTVGTTVNANAGACANTGSITANPSLGTAPYTYLWSPGGNTNQTATGLSVGTYLVNVSDHNACSASTSAVITAPAAVTAPTVVNSNTTSCGNTGSATVTPGGGTPAYTYSWSPGGNTNANATGLSAGSYVVTVTDANSCSATSSVLITAPTALSLHTIVNHNTSECTSIGKATVTANGGNTPYTYSWNTAPVQTNAQATGLSAGSYAVTVTDANNCTATAGAIITAPAVLVANATINSNATACTTGTATASATGGSTPYTYSWNTTPVQTSAAATGLSAGSYIVSVQDNSGCPSSFTIGITAPAALSNVVTGTNGSGCTSGSALAAPAGGTPPYTYSWNTVPVQTNANATGLSAGSYAVTVHDAAGCDNSSGSVTIIAAPPLVANAIVNSNASACANSGSATGSATGGTPPYTYLWSNGNTNATATGLSAGSYIVTVTDNSSCQNSDNITINAPAALSQTSSFIQPSCGASNGSANIIVSGGTTPYTYSWNTVPVQITPTAANLSAGTYIVTVTDANTCSLSTTVVVTNAPGETITFPSITNIDCRGASTGRITASVSGGVAPYTYSWSTTPPQTNNIASNLSAGAYILSVIDANGCPATANTSITQPATGMTVTTGGIVSLTCSGDSNGSAIATPVGGTTPYTYIWSPTGGNTPVASNLKSGVFTIIVTDAGGCSASATATIGNGNPSPVVSFGADSVKGCASLCNGFTDASTIGGGTLQTWAWNFGDGNTAAIQNPRHCFNNPGAYDVSLTVTSNLGCSSTATVHNMINVYTYPVAAFTFSPQPTTIMNPEIAFTDNSTDAYGIDQWLWTFGDLSDSVSTNKNTTHTYQDTGTYCATLKVTNKNNCTDSVTNCVVIMPQFTLYIPTGFTPNGDGINDVFKPVGEGMISYTMHVFNRWGNLVFTSGDINIGWNGRIGGTPGPEDVYIYDIEVVDNFGNAHSYIGEIALIQ